MSQVNSITIFTDSLEAANIVAGNTSANVRIVANSISFAIGNNLVINSSSINISNVSSPIYNTAINSTSISATRIVLNNKEYTSMAPQRALVDYQVFTSPAAASYWYKPAWAQANDIVTVVAWGAGGGGNTAAGGGGGACVIVNKLAGDCNSVCNVVVGTGGTSGVVGESSIFYYGNSTQTITAYGGGGTTLGTASPGGGGWYSAGTANAGGAPLGTVYGGAQTVIDSTFGGATANTTRAGDSIYGGGGGALGGAGGASIYGGGGGSGSGSVGTSIYGGNGGNISTAASAPGGGGAASNNVIGARGEVRVWTISSAIGTGSVDPIYSLTPNNDIVYPGYSLLYTVSTLNVSDGTVLYYTLNSTSVSSSDFTGAVNGSITINGGTNNFTLTVNASSVKYSNQFFMDLRTVSTTGTIVAKSSNSAITQLPVGQTDYITPGSYLWTAPIGVTNVHVLAVGAGGGGMSAEGLSARAGSGGGGGGLGWKNNIPVTEGDSYLVVVGSGGATIGFSTTTRASSGGDSYFISTATVAGFGGEGGIGNGSGGVGGSYTGDGGGAGGQGGDSGANDASAGAGGGAGGYAGAGGAGADTGSQNATAGSGGGGGGGGSGDGGTESSGGGGGVGILGQGTSGAAGTGTTAVGGGGGSGGSAGTTGANQNPNGGTYGGGGGGSGGSGDSTRNGGQGGGGAVRIIWGASRAWPSTNTTDKP